MLIHPAYVTAAAPIERARMAETGERHAAGASFLSATAYGVGGMIEDYLTYSRGWGFRPGEVQMGDMSDQAVRAAWVGA